MSGGGNEVRGLLRVSTTHALVSTWLTHFLPEFMELHPELKFEITATNQDIDLIWKTSDVAIRPYCHGNENLVQEYLMSWVLNLYASKDYIARFGYPKRVEDLDGHRLLIFADATSIYPKTYTHWPLFFGTKFGEMREPFLVINSLQAMFNLVKSGMGIGSFARGSPLFEEEELVPILPEVISKKVEVYYIYPKDYRALGKVVAFGTFLKEHSKKDILKFK